MGVVGPIRPFWLQYMVGEGPGRGVGFTQASAGLVSGSLKAWGGATRFPLGVKKQEATHKVSTPGIYS